MGLIEALGHFARRQKSEPVRSRWTLRCLDSPKNPEELMRAGRICSELEDGNFCVEEGGIARGQARGLVIQILKPHGPILEFAFLGLAFEEDRRIAMPRVAENAGVGFAHFRFWSL